MVEVFKTDVKDGDHAAVLVEIIQHNFPAYNVNFDLQDCDNILRIKSMTEPIMVIGLIKLLSDFGFNAEVLPDEIPASRSTRKHPLFNKAVFS